MFNGKGWNDYQNIKKCLESINSVNIYFKTSKRNRWEKIFKNIVQKKLLLKESHFFSLLSITYHIIIKKTNARKISLKWRYRKNHKISYFQRQIREILAANPTHAICSLFANNSFRFNGAAAPALPLARQGPRSGLSLAAQTRVVICLPFGSSVLVEIAVG